MKQKSIKDMEKELAALAGTKNSPEQSTNQDINDVEDYLNFERYPITEDERREFDEAVFAYNRRRYAVPGDPDPDNPEGFVAMQRKVKRILRSFMEKTQ